MKCLLDTHTVLWFFDDFGKLSETALNVILEPRNKKFVSVISVWELAIKINLGKLTFEGGGTNFLKIIEENGFKLLHVRKEYIRHIETLPPIHRDPFDRMLVATALTEGMSMITADTNIHQYDISCIW